MADLIVRTLDSSELRSASAVLRNALHMPAPTDAEWPTVEPTFEAERTFGAFLGDELIGSAGSFASRLAVPGGATLPMAAVNRVGVRADRTRRGALTALMRAQLAAFADAGEPVATLRASEAVIYGRFGYGVATRARTAVIRSPAGVRRVAVRPAGEVRLIDRSEAERVLPEIYSRIGLPRSGMIDRPAVWWRAALRRPVEGADQQFVVHRGPDGDNGFAVYRVVRERGSGLRAALVVDDLHAAEPAALVGLWRFLLGVDLIQEVRGRVRPLDEPVEWLLSDRRVCETTSVDDEAWLRLVDVPAALAARGYRAAEPVVIEVRDELLPANAGRYRISPTGAARTREPADLTVGVGALGSLYLGDVRPSTLALVGAITTHNGTALSRADRLFAADDIPWCGTFF